MRKFLFIFVFIFFLSGCTTFNPSKEVFKQKPDINSKTYDISIDTCWKAVKQVILKKNFNISYEDEDLKRIQAERFFQKRKRTIAVILAANLQPLEENQTTVYLNAIQTTEKLYKRSHRRFFLWIIPLPGGGGEEAERIKEGEKTIADKKFYEGFFEEIEKEIKKFKELGGYSPPDKRKAVSDIDILYGKGLQSKEEGSIENAVLNFKQALQINPSLKKVKK